jgi:hypothetical protein
MYWFPLVHLPVLKQRTCLSFNTTNVGLTTHPTYHQSLIFGLNVYDEIGLKLRRTEGVPSECTHNFAADSDIVRL